MKKSIRSFTKKLLYPFLKPYFDYYLSKKRSYRYKGIKVEISPGVFHPGFFLSTKLFINFLEGVDLKDRRVLELGAGSGLISIFASRKGAQVTASDINPVAIDCIEQNMRLNNLSFKVIQSDLFDNLSPEEFDLILINPPYYPKNPEKMSERAWYCGSEFQYFHKLFSQLGSVEGDSLMVYMILSEDCEIDMIMSIATKNGLYFKQVYAKVVTLETNFIFEIGK